MSKIKNKHPTWWMTLILLIVFWPAALVYVIFYGLKNKKVV